MDVVNSEIKQLGGSLDISSKRGEGTTFTIRLPFTLAVTHAIMVRIGEMFESTEPATLAVAVAGTAPLESIELYRGLELAYSHPLEAQPSKNTLRRLSQSSGGVAFSRY